MYLARCLKYRTIIVQLVYNSTITRDSGALNNDSDEKRVHKMGPRYTTWLMLHLTTQPLTGNASLHAFQMSHSLSYLLAIYMEQLLNTRNTLRQETLHPDPDGRLTWHSVAKNVFTRISRIYWFRWRFRIILSNCIPMPAIGINTPRHTLISCDYTRPKLITSKRQ